MRFLLVASDRGSQIPIEVPDEIIVRQKVVNKLKKSKSKSLKRNNKKSKGKVQHKKRQIAKALSK